MTLQEVKSGIVTYARSFLGISEVGDNRGFNGNDKYPTAMFTNMMKDRGWRPGLAWCAFWAELVWYGYYAAHFGKDHHITIALNDDFSGSSRTTYNNIERRGLLPITMEPEYGCMAIYKYTNSSWRGHVDAVVHHVENETRYRVIGGNVNDAIRDQSRELGSVANRELLGFIRPVADEDVSGVDKEELEKHAMAFASFAIKSLLTNPEYSLEERYSDFLTTL